MLTLPPLLAPGYPPCQGWCTLANIDRFKFLMEKVGLYRRVQGPQALLRQHERRIQVGREEGRWEQRRGRARMHDAARGLMALANCCALWQTNLLSVHHISIQGTRTLLRRSACSTRWSSAGRASRPRQLGAAWREQQRRQPQQHGLRSSQSSGQRSLLGSVPRVLHPPSGWWHACLGLYNVKICSWSGARKGEATEARSRRWGVVETETAGEARH